jgi:hypothetical protein
MVGNFLRIVRYAYGAQYWYYAGTGAEGAYTKVAQQHPKTRELTRVIRSTTNLLVKLHLLVKLLHVVTVGTVGTTRPAAVGWRRRRSRPPKPAKAMTLPKQYQT